RAAWSYFRTRTTGCSSRPTAASGTPRCSAGSTSTFSRPANRPAMNEEGRSRRRGAPFSCRRPPPEPFAGFVRCLRSTEAALSNRLKDNRNWLVVRDRALVPARERARGWRDWIVANDPVYAAVRRPGPPEKIAAGVTLLLVAALILFLLLFDWNMLRG